jgi:hypothetical protein
MGASDGLCRSQRRLSVVGEKVTLFKGRKSLHSSLIYDPYRVALPADNDSLP